MVVEETWWIVTEFKATVAAMLDQLGLRGQEFSLSKESTRNETEYEASESTGSALDTAMERPHDCPETKESAGETAATDSDVARWRELQASLGCTVVEFMRTGGFMCC